MEIELRNKILEKILPSKSEKQKLNATLDLLTKSLWETINNNTYDISFIEPHGSTGLKQTQLKGDSDIDLFIGLNPEYYNSLINIKSRKERIKKIKELFLGLCNDIIIPSLNIINAKNINLTYAEHPYISAELNTFSIDIVGCFNIDLEFIKEFGPITAVDRTPHHTKFINNNLTNEMKNDVRILKSFFRANHIYGDKSAIGRFGFTGFSAELLIYYFNNLDNLFNKFEDLPKKPIDYYKRPTDYFKKIARFKNDYLILIDPIDKNRNVASSISARAFKFALKKINEFKYNSSLDFFIRKEIPTTVSISNEEKDKFVVIELESDGSRHYTEVRDKLYKWANSLKKQLELETSRVPRFSKTLFEVYFEDLNFVVIFYTKKGRISESFKRRGPSIKNKINFDRFKNKHPNFFIEKDRAYIIQKREFCVPIDLISDHVKRYKLFSGITFKHISNLGVSKIGKKAVYIMKNMIIPIELDKKE
ncbi:MAG: hypothetical protein ACTSQO_03200 [Candidatus Helarchaeota archaeon]